VNRRASATRMAQPTAVRSYGCGSGLGATIWLGPIA
jgi:hypothetical protein